MPNESTHSVGAGQVATAEGTGCVCSRIMLRHEELVVEVEGVIFAKLVLAYFDSSIPRCAT